MCSFIHSYRRNFKLTRKCKYYNEITEDWSDEGIVTAKAISADGEQTFSCNTKHNTSFAIILVFSPLFRFSTGLPKTYGPERRPYNFHNYCIHQNALQLFNRVAPCSKIRLQSTRNYPTLEITVTYHVILQ